MQLAWLLAQQQQDRLEQVEAVVAEGRLLPLAELAVQVQPQAADAAQPQACCWWQEQRQAATPTLATAPPSACRPPCESHSHPHPLTGCPRPPYRRSVQSRVARAAASVEETAAVQGRLHRRCGGRKDERWVTRPARRGGEAHQERLRTEGRESWCGRRCGRT